MLAAEKMSHINGFLFLLSLLFSSRVSACVRLAGTMQNCLMQELSLASARNRSEGTEQGECVDGSGTVPDLDEASPAGVDLNLGVVVVDTPIGCYL
jgi:hypothetical protein